MRRTAGLLVAVALLAGCGGGEGEERAEAPTAEETTAPAPTQERARPLRPGPLRPGRYKTKRFHPALSFTVPRGWTANPEHPLFVGLAYRDARRNFVLAFVRPARVVDPSRTYRSLEVPEKALLPVPEDLVGWLATHPRHKAGPRFAARVGDEAGEAVDVRVVSGYRAAGCSAPCVFTFSIEPGFVLFSDEGQKIRGIVIDVAGEEVLVAVLADEETFGQSMRKAQELLATVDFGN